MESASVMQEMSFRKNPRDGQGAVIAKSQEKGRAGLNAQLPTGYGKTFTACAVYSVLKKGGAVNRLLYITPTSSQHEQFVFDGYKDLDDACVEGPLTVCDVMFEGVGAIRRNRKNERQVFAITIQSLIARRGSDFIADLLSQGRWMVVVDEYHHYGFDAQWGKAVLRLNTVFRLAMSATPSRKNGDSAFGDPDVSVSYEQAVKEGAVKPLVGHAYTYKVEAITGDGDVVVFTTRELAEEMGDGDKLEKRMIEKQMRWSPRYISPLVSVPLERMLSNRLDTGVRLQAIVGAMCVSHAEMVCEQVSSMFPELSVDWVGTGKNGRKPEQNRKIIKRFCPPKDLDSGKRSPELDVLVHVGMAGEGLDSVHVSEVIHLNPASLNNSNNQENGRAARYLDGVTGHINFDSCSDYARLNFVGRAIEQAFDKDMAEVCSGCGSLPCECEPNSNDPAEYKELPDEPAIVLAGLELMHIDSGSPEVKRVQKMLATNQHFKGFGITPDNMNEPEHVNQALELYKLMRTQEAEQHNEKAVVKQWKDSVDVAVGQIASLARKKSGISSSAVSKTFIGDKKRLINSKKKAACGPILNTVESAKMHYKWIKAVERSILDQGVPQWLL
jgi:superfamily II DNA or RNA helicase